jgi:hypothetical protein
VVVNKKAKDERIGEMIQQLDHQFSRFIVLEEIHSAPKMRAYIGTTYRLGIDFLREATYYYLRSSLGWYPQP